LKLEPSILSHSLRAVALVITLVSLVTFATVGYSVYAVASNVTNTLGGSSHTPAITAKVVVSGSVATAYLNVTLTNNGFYPIALSLDCSPPAGSGISCTNSLVRIDPGQTQTLNFAMTVENYSQYAPEGIHVDGLVQATLEPFASVNMTVDLGTLLTRGGA